MEFKYLNSIRDSKDYWRELKINSYTAKYELYEELYDLLCSNRIPDVNYYSNPYIVVGLDNDKVVGILPFISRNNVRTLIYNYGLFIGYNLPIIPSYLHLFIENVKENIDLINISNSYMNKEEEFSKYYYWNKANIIDLRNIFTIDDYLYSLSKKNRQSLRKIIELNKDIIIKKDIIPDKEYHKIQRMYNVKHWIKKKGFSIALRMAVYDVLFKHSDVQTTVLYLNDKIVAVNKCIIDNNTIVDYICLRPTYYNNFIGVYSIYKNIEVAISKHIDYYDMASELGENLTIDGIRKSYKKRFLNKPVYSPCCLSVIKSEELFPPYYKNGWVF